MAKGNYPNKKEIIKEKKFLQQKGRKIRETVKIWVNTIDFLPLLQFSKLCLTAELK